jgi:hypothetical protein
LTALRLEAGGRSTIGAAPSFETLSCKSIDLHESSSG